MALEVDRAQAPIGDELVAIKARQQVVEVGLPLLHGGNAQDRVA
jgi:hypothetical protein